MRTLQYTPSLDMSRRNREEGDMSEPERRPNFSARTGTEGRAERRRRRRGRRNRGAGRRRWTVSREGCRLTAGRGGRRRHQHLRGRNGPDGLAWSHGWKDELQSRSRHHRSGARRVTRRFTDMRSIGRRIKEGGFYSVQRYSVVAAVTEHRDSFCGAAHHPEGTIIRRRQRWARGITTNKHVLTVQQLTRHKHRH